jgi:hypothetical protein
MAKLTWQPLFEHGASLGIEIEVLPLKDPDYQWAPLKVCFLVNDEVFLEMESSANPALTHAPLEWLEKERQTSKKRLSEAFYSTSSFEHQVIIEQYRLSKKEFAEAQAELGQDQFPYPFVYDITILVNPDSEALWLGGFGMRLSGKFTYPEIYNFLNQVHLDMLALCPWKQEEA